LEPALFPFVGTFPGLPIRSLKQLDPGLQTTTGRGVDCLWLAALSGADAYILHNEFQSKDELEAAIELERRLELIGEGHRWFNLLQRNKAIETMNQWFSANSISISTGRNDLLLPIPQNQIDTNPSLVQHPDYL